MNMAMWTVILAAAVGLALFVQRFLRRRADRLVRESKVQMKRERRAASDKRDIAALTSSLQSSLAESDPIPTLTAAAAGEVRRQRASSMAPHGFDPDLPAR